MAFLLDDESCAQLATVGPRFPFADSRSARHRGRALAVPACFFQVGLQYQHDRSEQMTKPYQTAQPERSAIDAMAGVVALDFGTNWCGYCRAAEPVIERALSGHAGVSHVKVEDGPGRPLGRSFRVKLWPTVVVLKDGQEVARVVRPDREDELGDALARAAAQ
jgi:thioredoxin 1